MATGEASVMARANSKRMLPNGRAKGSEGFFKALHAIFDHPEYIALSKQTRAFIWDLARQYNLRNNGDLSAALGAMEQWGWTQSELKRARKEALEAGWIEVTRYPRFPRDPTLYRLAWLPTSPELKDREKLEPAAFRQQVKRLK
ncbi:hypothetical protein [Haliea sp. E17]|uniref:hypothetical protein n=1 Tax=Haliea sp. E17 TaxID=3401576 RepID=UPI003AAC45AD